MSFQDKIHLATLSSYNSLSFFIDLIDEDRFHVEECINQRQFSESRFEGRIQNAELTYNNRTDCGNIRPMLIKNYNYSQHDLA